MRPTGNGLIELVDEKSSDKGFFCMKLAGFIQNESKTQLTLDKQDLWELRFSEAKKGNCAYRNECPIYARTKAAHPAKPIQLMLNF